MIDGGYILSNCDLAKAIAKLIMNRGTMTPKEVQMELAQDFPDADLPTIAGIVTEINIYLSCNKLEWET